jgi:imidazolonepropionase
MKTIYHNIKQIVNPSQTERMDELNLLENSAFLVENGKITDLAEEKEILKKYPDAKKVNLEQNLVFPGFVDPHTHPVFFATREEEFEMRLQGKSYEEIAAAGGGIRNSVRKLRTASEDELFEISLPRVKKFLEYGTTTIEAKSGYGLSLKDELKMLRVIKRLNEELPLDLIPTFLGAHEIPDEFQGKKEEYVKIIIEEMIPRVAEENLAEYCDVFCEKGIFELEDTERILEAGKKYGLKARFHADELYPLGGAELAAKVGAVSADHLLQVSDAGIKAMRESNVTPIVLPGTAFFIRKPNYAPARKMIDEGCQLALATDFNPGSSYTQNLQFIMSLSCLNMGMLPTEVINAVTKNSAGSLQRFDKIASIEIGKNADFVVMDIPNYKYLVYNYGINHAKTVYKNGEIVFNSNF